MAIIAQFTDGILIVQKSVGENGMGERRPTGTSPRLGCELVTFQRISTVSTLCEYYRRKSTDLFLLIRSVFEHTLPSDPYSLDKMMTREHSLRDCLSDPYTDFFAKESLQHIMDPHQIHFNVSTTGSSKKLYEDDHSTSFQCAAPLFELPHSNPMNMLLYEMPPMGMYPSSSRSELEVNTSAHLPTVFPIPSATYLHQSHSPSEYIPNGYSPPPQDPIYPPKPPSQHLSPLIKPKKRIQAVPCHSNSVCANCKTTETTLWRRAKTGEIECK
ncbi:hypothetical protein Y032_0121g1012 [Ancylostoma ceylanicum]|nr:hypothetical protein Y032_0121g1012 [Ancylostoma ceylanicum]